MNRYAPIRASLATTTVNVVVALLLPIWMSVDAAGRWSKGSLTGLAALTLVSVAVVWLAFPAWMRSVTTAWPVLALVTVAIISAAGVAFVSGNVSKFTYQQGAIGVLAVGTMGVGLRCAMDRGTVVRVLNGAALLFGTTAAVYLLSIPLYHPTWDDHVYGARGYAIVGALGTAFALAYFRLHRRLAVALVVLQGVAVAVSDSRMALATIVVLVAVVPLVAAVRSKKWKTAAALVVGDVVVVGALGGLLLSVHRFREHLTGGPAPFHILGFRVNSNARALIWPHAWHYFKQAPLLGHGLGSASEYVHRIYHGALEHPHNDYLRMLDDGGVLLTLVLLVAGALAVRQMRQRFVAADDALSRTASAAGLLVGVAFCLIMITDNPMAYEYAAGPTAFLIGLAMGVPGGRRRDHGLVTSPLEAATTSDQPARLETSR